MPEHCLVHWHIGERRSYCHRRTQADDLCEYHQRYNGSLSACRCDLDEAMARIKVGQLSQIHKEV